MKAREEMFQRLTEIIWNLTYRQKYRGVQFDLLGQGGVDASPTPLPPPRKA